MVGRCAGRHVGRDCGRSAGESWCGRLWTSREGGCDAAAIASRSSLLPASFSVSARGQLQEYLSEVDPAGGGGGGHEGRSEGRSERRSGALRPRIRTTLGVTGADVCEDAELESHTRVRTGRRHISVAHKVAIQGERPLPEMTLLIPLGRPSRRHEPRGCLALLGLAGVGGTISSSRAEP